jgi:hypothetical protein
MTNELIDYYEVDKKVMELRGFDSNPIDSFTNINKLALPKNNNEN